MYEDGMIDNHSFGFGVMKHKMEGKIRYILEYKMIEVSTVTLWASNFSTPTIDVKEQQAAVLKDTAKNNSWDSLYMLEPSRQTLKQKADILELCKLIDINNLKF